ncbi:potassium channel family protein [Treponema pedis]|uniref:TrkA family potassium uptake protein n=1 Tax=Treponema pedis TaxID=409322 RepID=A0A7S7AWX7_9SPIR|nr:TrkA family potassium uptake protein [Treponema pedis]QOW61402.1 TrkA family potassium uptake protein [Treponema pedis]QSI03638.1 TrkA family potassium uptake protein [Treponema pedis]
MKKFAIMGLGTFGIRMLDELSKIGAEISIIDSDKDIVDKYKGKAASAHVIEDISETSLRKVLTSKTDTVIVDFTRKIELSVLSTTILKNIGIENIVVRAQSDEHGQLLQTVGATQIIYPDSEAAKRTTPILAAELLFKFMPIAKDLALAEVGIDKKYIGKSLIEANLRKDFCVNIVARRKKTNEEFVFMDDPNYKFEEDDVLLIVASEENIYAFTEGKIPGKTGLAAAVFKNLFSGK